MNSSVQDPVRWRGLAAVFCLAFAMLLYEILLTRIMSIITWYHFAFMVISVAMLGMGAAGSLWGTLKQSAVGRALCSPEIGSICFAVSTPIVMTGLSMIEFDLFGDAARYDTQLLVCLTYFLAAIPFFFAGLVMTSLLSGYSEQATLYYGFDLLGAGVGCLAALPVMGFLGAPGGILLAGSASALAAVMFSGSLRCRSGLIGLLIATSILIAIPHADRLFPVRPGPDKMLSFLSRDTDSACLPLFRTIQKQIAASRTGHLEIAGSWPKLDLLSSTWDRLARIDVSAYPDRHAIYGIGASSTFHGTIPEQIMITQDGDAATFITRFDGNYASLKFIDRFLYGLAYTVRTRPRVLVIGSGGGTDVLAALKHDAVKVDAVELNEATVRAVKQDHAEFAGGIYSDSRVRIQVGEGRSLVRRSRETYDLIQMTGVDTWTASSQGAYVLSENFLYTVEAFEDFYDHLSNDGVLSIIRARFSLPRESLRLCSLGIEMLERKGVEAPGRRIIVVSEMASVPNLYAGMLLKKGEWTDDEIESIRSFCAVSGFQIVGGPGCELDTPFSYLLDSPDPRSVYREYPFDIRPVFDNNPFFFKFHRWSHVRMTEPLARCLGVDLGARPGTGHESGLAILLLILGQTVILSILLIWWPVRSAGKGSRSIRGRFRILLFCGSVGIGFIFLEIALIQKFSLFLAYPTRTLTVILFALLISSGIGSLVSRRLSVRHIPFLTVVIACLGTLMVWKLEGLTRDLLTLPDTVRMLSAAFMTGVIGVFMGCLFPLFIREIGRERNDMIAWAWAINGCASVIGSVIAVLVALHTGFDSVMIIGVVAYLTAGLAAPAEVLS